MRVVIFCMGFPGGSVVKNLPANQSLSRDDPPLEKVATHSSILAWEIPWIEEPGGLQSMGLQRVGHDLVTEHTHIIFCLPYSPSFWSQDFSSWKTISLVLLPACMCYPPLLDSMLSSLEEALLLLFPILFHSLLFKKKNWDMIHIP